MNARKRTMHHAEAPSPRDDRAACRRRGPRAGHGADLSERADQDIRRLSARRHHRHHRARRRPASWRRPGTRPVIVENRAGANGAIAAAQLAKVPPDGQTLMMIVSGHITNPLVSPNAGYDAHQGLHRHQPAGVVAALDLRASGLSGERHQGRDRARQGKAQHDRLRDAGRRLDPAALDGAAGLSERRQVPPCALPRRRAGAERHHRRPCADQRAERVPGAALHPGRASSSRSR